MFDWVIEVIFEPALALAISVLILFFRAAVFFGVIGGVFTALWWGIYGVTLLF